MSPWTSVGLRGACSCHPRPNKLSTSKGHIVERGQSGFAVRGCTRRMTSGELGALGHPRLRTAKERKGEREQRGCVDEGPQWLGTSTKCNGGREQGGCVVGEGPLKGVRTLDARLLLAEALAVVARKNATLAAAPLTLQLRLPSTHDRAQSERAQAQPRLSGLQMQLHVCAYEAAACRSTGTGMPSKLPTEAYAAQAPQLEVVEQGCGQRMTGQPTWPEFSHPALASKWPESCLDALCRDAAFSGRLHPLHAFAVGPALFGVLLPRQFNTTELVTWRMRCTVTYQRTSCLTQRRF